MAISFGSILLTSPEHTSVWKSSPFNPTKKFNQSLNNKKILLMGQVIQIDREWWAVFRMLKESMNYCRKSNNAVSLRKEKGTFSYLVEHLTMPENAPVIAKAA